MLSVSSRRLASLAPVEPGSGAGNAKKVKSPSFASGWAWVHQFFARIPHRGRFVKHRMSALLTFLVDLYIMSQTFLFLGPVV
jgi:hypothetical protein